MSEMKSLTLNGVKYDTFPDQTSRKGLEDKLNKQQGAENNGKPMVIGADGIPAPGEWPEASADVTAEAITNALGYKPVGPDDVPEQSPEQIAEAVSAWLDEHPEATTTVADGSVTPAKTDFLEVRQVSEPLELTWGDAGYNMIATNEFVDIREVDVVTVVHTGATGGASYALFTEEQSQILGYTNAPDVAKHYDANDVSTVVTTMNTAALREETGAAYMKVRVNQNTNIAYTLSVYAGEIETVGGFYWSAKYGMPQLPDGTVTLAQTNFMVRTGENLIDTTRFDDSGYSGTLFDQFGASISVFQDMVDVSVNKTVYIRARTKGPANGPFATKIACYDGEGNFLSSDNSLVTETLIRTYSDVVTEGSTYVSGANTCVYRYDFDETVKFAKFACKTMSMASSVPRREYKNVISSYEDILDMTSTPEAYWRGVSEEWKNAFLGIVNDKEPKTMVMIGDSLTNWGGGGDDNGGFLGIVHEKTGVITSNEGTAGAWWQLSGSQTAADITTNGVGRVNAIIKDNRKYDLYCFMLGTNAGSNTDTGETSADPSTMCGAIRYCMEKLKAYDPTGQILVCLPPQRAEGNDNQEKVNAVIKAIVESYGVRTLDIYHNGGIVPNTKIADVGYLSDGLHLGENGIQALGKALAAEVKYMLCI